MKMYDYRVYNLSNAKNLFHITLFITTSLKSSNQLHQDHENNFGTYSSSLQRKKRLPLISSS